MPNVIVTPQSTVPNGRRSERQAIDAIAYIPGDLIVLPPHIIAGVGGTALIALERCTGAAFRVIQNLGTAAVYWLVGNSETADNITNFHGVLAAGNAVDDGLGSVQTFTAVRERVTIFSTGTIRVATFEARMPKDMPDIPLNI